MASAGSGGDGAPPMFAARLIAVVGGAIDQPTALRRARILVDAVNGGLGARHAIRLAVVERSLGTPEDPGCMHDQRSGLRVCRMAAAGRTADAEGLEDLQDAGAHRTTCAACLAALIEREEACLRHLRQMLRVVNAS